MSESFNVIIRTKTRFFLETFWANNSSLNFASYSSMYLAKFSVERSVMPRVWNPALRFV